MGIKGVILAAGYGTRFLPVTRCLPKEMLPLVDRPAIDFAGDEVNRGPMFLNSRGERTLVRMQTGKRG